MSLPRWPLRKVRVKTCVLVDARTIPLGAVGATRPAPPEAASAALADMSVAAKADEQACGEEFALPESVRRRAGIHPEIGPGCTRLR